MERVINTNPVATTEAFVATTYRREQGNSFEPTEFRKAAPAYTGRILGPGAAEITYVDDNGHEYYDC